MKLLILLLFILAPRSFLSQEFKSSATAHPKIQYELEFIDRNIDFKEDMIIITSKGKEITDKQKLNIQSFEQKEFENIGLCTWYYTSKDLPGTQKIVIVPLNEKPKQVVIFEPVENAVNFREFRIILE